jgi:YegS/Rv2252/BmrU family lipid kinase
MSARFLPVILNLDAGRGHSAATAMGLRDAFARHGLEAEVHVAANGDDIRRLAQEALERGPEAIVAAGGDGTVSAVAACLRGTGVAMAVLPVGTLNHFARDLGVPQDVDEAVAAIAAGRRVAVDLGEVNDRTFVNNASLGLYPDIVRDRLRQQRRLGRGKYWAMAWAVVAAVRRSAFLHLRLDVDGRERHFRSPFVFVGNNDYTMEGFSIGTRSSLRDGRLSIYTTQRRSRLGLLGLALRALVGRLRQADDFAIASARTLRIDSRRRRLLVATDGELVAMETPLAFRVLPGALQVIVPA